MTPETCPNCGADVPRGAKACPECGSDETTGWAEDAYVGKLGLPDEDFDYEEFTKREFQPEKSPLARPEGVRPFWWIAALVLAALLLLWWLGLR